MLDDYFCIICGYPLDVEAMWDDRNICRECEEDDDDELEDIFTNNGEVL